MPILLEDEEVVSRKDDAVPLNLAALCLDCGYVTAGLIECQRCASKSTLPLAPILDRKEAA